MRVNAEGFKDGDRVKIELPTIQRNMLKELHSIGKPVVFVLSTGSAIALEGDEPNYDALLNAWYGGQSAGAAVADVLFGDYNPAGRLPVTFYKSTAQLPDFENYDMSNRTYRFFKEAALYPFGFGLSYTKFDYSKLALSTSNIKNGQGVRLSLNIKNTGKIDGDEVLQVYIKCKKDKSQPIKSLKAFKRINIKAGKTEKVVFDIASDSFKTYIEQKGGMGIAEGDYEIMVGGSSLEKDLLTKEINIYSK
jgi:beta-glucosidase